MTRRALVLLSLALVCLSSVTGVGSVSSAAVDRGVSVAVADDEQAYLGIAFEDADGSDGVETLVVTHRASTDDLEVTVGNESQRVGPGEQATFTAECVSTSEVNVTAIGSGVRIEATRPVDCSAASDTDDEADGVEGDDDDDAEGEDDSDDADNDEEDDSENGDGDENDEDDEGDDSDENDEDDEGDDSDEDDGGDSDD